MFLLLSPGGHLSRWGFSRNSSYRHYYISLWRCAVSSYFNKLRSLSSKKGHGGLFRSDGHSLIHEKKAFSSHIYPDIRRGKMFLIFEKKLKNIFSHKKAPVKN